MLFVTDEAAMPKKATMPNNKSTSDTLIVDVICALNVDMPKCCFFSIYTTLTESLKTYFP